ncbi:MAG: hypothetical protein CM1200mP2_03190 [Planctomycetaceae bacterium]|nr:MAG: hypothetical protein CM1200mP2_03190 [Planctomycetaceae bacterium]
MVCELASMRTAAISSRNGVPLFESVATVTSNVCHRRVAGLVGHRDGDRRRAGSSFGRRKYQHSVFGVVKHFDLVKHHVGQWPIGSVCLDLADCLADELALGQDSEDRVVEARGGGWGPR